MTKDLVQHPTQQITKKIFIFLSLSLFLFSLASAQKTSINGEACNDTNFSLQIIIPENSSNFELVLEPQELLNSSLKLSSLTKDINKNKTYEVFFVNQNTTNLDNMTLLLSYNYNNADIKENQTFTFKECEDVYSKASSFFDKSTKFLINYKNHVLLGLLSIFVIILMIILIKTIK